MRTACCSPFPNTCTALPGSFKNALDWMVGCQRFPGKPVALCHVTARHAYAPVQLEEILKTMSARIVAEAGFNLDLKTNHLDVEAICADPGFIALIQSRLTAFAAAA